MEVSWLTKPGAGSLTPPSPPTSQHPLWQFTDESNLPAKIS